MLANGGCTRIEIQIEYFNGGTDPLTFNPTPYAKDLYYTAVAIGRTGCLDTVTYPDACYLEVVTPSTTYVCPQCTASGDDIFLDDCDASGIFITGPQGPAPSFYTGPQGEYPIFFLSNPGVENGVDYCAHPFWAR